MECQASRSGRHEPEHDERHEQQRERGQLPADEREHREQAGERGQPHVRPRCRCAPAPRRTSAKQRHDHGRPAIVVADQPHVPPLVGGEEDERRQRRRDGRRDILPQGCHVVTSFSAPRPIDRARARRAVRRARAARLHARRPDRAGPGDRARRARLDRRPARRLDRRAGRRHLPARAPRRRRRCSATTSARTRGRASCSPRSCGSGPRAAPPTARSRSTEDATPAPALRVHRRALVRPARDRGPGPRVHGGRLRRPATTGARREGAFIVAVNCGQAARDVLLRLDGHGAAGDLRLRPRADRGARRRRPPLPRRGRQRARRRGARRAAAARRRTPPSWRPPSARSRTPPPMQTPRARHRRHQGPALPQPRAPALGRGRRPLPDVRQLHDGLPDLLLPHGRGRHRPRRRGGRAHARSGTRASRSSTPTSTAAASARRRRRATASG